MKLGQIQGATNMQGDQVRLIKSTAEGAEKSAKDVGIDKAISRVLKGESTPKEAMGMTDAMIEAIYGQAYRLYNTGKYADASRLFRLLVMLVPIEPKFPLGLAASFHMMKDYRNAIQIYTFCSIADAQNPVPHYHAADCYMQLGDLAGAIVAMEMAAKRAGDKTEYKTLKDRALLTIESLKKALTEKGIKTRG